MDPVNGSVMRRRAGTLLLALFLLSGWGARDDSAAFEPVEPGVVSRWRSERGPLLIVDVRSTQQFDEKHIEGAMNIPYVSVAGKGLPKTGRIVLYDGGIGTTEAREAAEKLESAGYAPVYVLGGGLARWEAQGLPLVVPAGVLRGGLVEYVTAGELGRAMQDGLPMRVVDLRPPGSFQAGTVPGGVNAAQGAVLAFLGGRGKDSLVVLIDDGGGEADREAAVLRRNGYRVVRVLFGGYPAWSRRGAQ